MEENVDLWWMFSTSLQLPISTKIYPMVIKFPCAPFFPSIEHIPYFYLAPSTKEKISDSIQILYSSHRLNLWIITILSIKSDIMYNAENRDRILN